MAKKPRRVLVVEDDLLFARALMRMLATLRTDATHVTTLAQALAAVEKRFDAVLLDVRLPDGSGVTLVEKAVRMRPLPLIIAVSGQANRKDAFALGRHGVSRFLEKPVTMQELAEALEARAEHPANALEVVAAQSVGHLKVQEVTAQVRQVMYEQALAKTNGNVKAAGEMLGVTRQAVSKAKPPGER